MGAPLHNNTLLGAIRITYLKATWYESQGSRGRRSRLPWFHFRGLGGEFEGRAGITGETPVLPFPRPSPQFESLAKSPSVILSAAKNLASYRFFSRFAPSE